MRSSEELSIAVLDLQRHVDCLLIRIDSCEQYIQRLLIMVSESTHDKYSSVDDINSFDPISPYNRARTDKKFISEVTEHRSVSQNGVKEKFQSSLKEFLIFPHTKEAKAKQIDAGSLTLLKNAVLVNCHEVEKIEESYNEFRKEMYEKFDKSDQAIKLLTNVTGFMQDKIEDAIENISKIGGLIEFLQADLTVKKKRNKSSSKYSMNPSNFA